MGAGFGVGWGLRAVIRPPHGMEELINPRNNGIPRHSLAEDGSCVIHCSVTAIHGRSGRVAFSEGEFFHQQASTSAVIWPIAWASFTKRSQLFSKLEHEQ